MKITIEAHTKDRAPDIVVVSSPVDDLNIREVGDMIQAALLAWGFAEENVNDLIAGEG